MPVVEAQCNELHIGSLRPSHRACVGVRARQERLPTVEERVDEELVAVVDLQDKSPLVQHDVDGARGAIGKACFLVHVSRQPNTHTLCNLQLVADNSGIPLHTLSIDNLWEVRLYPGQVEFGCSLVGDGEEGHGLIAGFLNLGDLFQTLGDVPRQDPGAKEPPQSASRRLVGAAQMQKFEKILITRSSSAVLDQLDVNGLACVVGVL